jgi:hypothetical protein
MDITAAEGITAPHPEQLSDEIIPYESARANGLIY